MTPNRIGKYSSKQGSSRRSLRTLSLDIESGLLGFVVCKDSQPINQRYKLVIYDKDVQHGKAGPTHPSPLSHVGPKLFRRSNIPADTSLHRHTDTWILHGCRKQPGNLDFRSNAHGFLLHILHLYLPTFHPLNELTSLERA